ncbi:MAG: glycoside hydrolase family 125 protein [Thermoanaerobacteraceae bacterium]|nr:glycoside hydrolase family 125 protein [Thermoanaerobacteraceae bacterium]
MLLTIPPELDTAGNNFLQSGNEYVSLPWIDERGAVKQVGVMHLAAKSLLQFEGDAGGLLCPFVKLNGEEVPLDWAWGLLEHWLPVGRGDAQGLTVTAGIVTPVETKGFLYRLTAVNRGAAPCSLTLGIKGAWKGATKTIFHTYQLNGKNMFFHEWTGTLVLEITSGLPLAALALGGNVNWQESRLEREEFRLQRTAMLQPNQRMTVVIYAAVNQEADGAATGVIHLRRLGWRKLFQDTLQWLREHKPGFPEHRLRSTFYRNLWFNYFYAAGRAVDSDEIVAVTSRSPRYYVSSAFWSRDTLLWSFPAVLLVSPARAREILQLVFTRHVKAAGEHAHYIDGTVLYPGFELDQVAAYILALARYLTWTGAGILKEEDILRGFQGVTGKLLANRDATGLYRTMLDPSDDPVSYPYLTYDNVLCWRALKEAAGIYHRMGNNKRCIQLQQLARHLKRAIYRHCVVDGPAGRMFAWATDARGNYELYDVPPGSLQLLAWYGFCDSFQAVYQNTVNWIHSAHNPYYYPGRFPGVGSRHASYPWLLALCNDLLTDRYQQALPVLEGLTMDSGYACETYSAEDGSAVTGAAFATCAGFLAYALWECFQKNS